jgi:putative solute:sodium symporter small subunit
MAPVIDPAPPRPAPPPVAPPAPDAARRHWRANLILTAILLAAWFCVGFAIPWFARDLDFAFFGWPFSFWVAAQGGTCAFGVLVAAYALAMRRLDRRLAAQRPPAAPPPPEPAPEGPSAGTVPGAHPAPGAR